ncbi:MAG TPA: nicotinate-nucleotide adenylyltransferase, partial [Burkholderiales bacterium]|nr:nicotinate-nucleotide adenylyltransferase [Burkholderiales bacterium]
MRERIGLFGGTFNPIHLGHLKAAAEVRAAFGLGRVLFIPSYIPPHKTSPDIASAADRFRMVELACDGREGFVASALEVEARERSYSIVTLAKVKGLYPEAWTFFILGIDAFLEIGTWHEYDRVLDECLFIVTDRPGFDLESASGVLGGRLRDRTCRVTRGGPVDEALFSRFGVFLLPIQALDISATGIRRRVRRGERPDGLVPAPVA